MPHVLDVFAIPRGERSRTRKIRNAFLAGLRESNPAVTFTSLDLAKMHSDLPDFDEWDVQAKFEMAYGEGKLDERGAQRWEALTRLTDQLYAANLVLVSAPMWNFSVPWMLKKWIDSVLQSRLTFEFVKGQFQGLLGGRRGVIITSRDGAYSAPPYAAMDYQVPYLKQVMGFVGLAPVDVVVAEPMVLGGPQLGAQMLEKAIADAGALGRRLGSELR